MNRKTICKWFWAWDFEKEESWLNQLALQGWVLDGVGFVAYHFAASDPGEYTVRLEMRGHDQRYIDFMAEIGCGICWPHGTMDLFPQKSGGWDL